MTTMTKKVSPQDRWADWVVVGVVIVALLLGWALKVSAENKTLSYSSEGVTVHYPYGWLLDNKSGYIVKVSDPNCVNNRILNNIFYSYHSYRGSINVPATRPSGLESDYNVVVDRFTTDDGDSVITLSEWQMLDYDSHSFIATPDALFVNPAGYDYHLREGSPAIDAGWDGAGVTTDLEGYVRPAGAGFDIGAYELQASGTFTEHVYLPFVIRVPDVLKVGRGSGR